MVPVARRNLLAAQGRPAGTPVAGLAPRRRRHDPAREAGGVVAVPHDPRVDDIAERVLRLEDGRLEEPGLSVAAGGRTLA
jgi:hypothetical protein